MTRVPRPPPIVTASWPRARLPGAVRVTRCRPHVTRDVSHVTRHTSHVTSSIVEQLRSQNHPSIEDSSIPTCRAAPLHGNMGEAAQACRSAIGSKSTTDSSRGYLSCVLPQSPNKCRSSTCRFAPFFKKQRAVMQSGWYAQCDDTRRSTCCGSKAAEGQGIGIQRGFEFGFWLVRECYLRFEGRQMQMPVRLRWLAHWQFPRPRTRRVTRGKGHLQRHM